MKKFLSAILIIAVLAIFTGNAGAFIVHKHNFVSDNTDTTIPGLSGIINHAADNTTAIWTVPTSLFTKATGFNFWIKNVNGNSTLKPKLNFYTSFFFSGNTDWAEVPQYFYSGGIAWAMYSPDNASIVPLDYNLTMPGKNMVWIENIKIPEGTQRVKSVVTFFDNNSTDNITLRAIATTR